MISYKMAASQSGDNATMTAINMTKLMRMIIDFPTTTMIFLKLKAHPLVRFPA